MTTLEALGRMITSMEADERRRKREREGTRRLWREFGRMVRAERKARRIRLDEFSRRMGLSSGMISYLESGTRQWSLAQAKKAIKMLVRHQMWPDCPVGPRR